MKTFRCTSRWVLILATFAPLLHAQTVRPNGDNDSWYFTLGGSEPYVNYRQTNRTNVNLHAGAEWSLLRSCQFDPRTSIGETFSDAQRSVYGLANDVVASAPGLLTSWGLSKVQENYPGVYDFLTKGLVDAKVSYQVAIKSCQDMRKDADAGRNPIDGWFRISKTSNWDVAASTGENPTRVNQDSGNRGIIGPNGEQRGGLLSPPIRTVQDTITAGYTHVTSGLANDPTEDPVAGNRNITRAFPTAAAASRWTADVIGERTVRTCDGCEKLVTTIGQGLRLKQSEERDIIKANLTAALNAPRVTRSMLDQLSVPGMGIVATEGTLRAIRNSPPTERSVLATRYVSELALARVMEKALIARDLLNVGQQEPNIAANPEYQREIDFSKHRLDEELDNIMFENDARKKVLNNAASTLTARDYERSRSPAGNQLKALPAPSRGMKDGGIKE